MAEAVVVDASAMADLLLGNDLASRVETRLRGRELHAPAHLDAEILSALGRLQRAGDLSSSQVETRLERLAAAPLERHALGALLVGAWRRRHNLRLVDALYAELGAVLGVPVVTTDGGLAVAHPTAELIVGSS